MRILVIGRSHAVCIVNAAEHRNDDSDIFQISSIFTNSFEPIWDWNDKSEPLKFEFREILKEKLNGADIVALVIQGNQHSIISLIQQDPKIDFVYPFDGDSSVQEDALLVPKIMVRNWFSNNLLELRLIARYLRKNYHGPVFCLGPPPPIEDKAEVSKRLDPYFLTADRTAESLHISPAAFRMKCWHLMDEVYKAESDQEALHFLPVPEEAVSKGGFLAEAAWGTSATHANSWYGRLRIHQIMKAASGGES